MGRDYRGEMPQKSSGSKKQNPSGATSEEAVMLTHAKAVQKICVDSPVTCVFGNIAAAGGVAVGVTAQVGEKVLAQQLGDPEERIRSGLDYTKTPRADFFGILKQASQHGVNVGADVVYTPPPRQKNKGHTPD